MGSKLVKGQKLYRENPRTRDREVVEELTVATVGTKYFTLVEYPDTRYLLETRKSEHNPHLPLYLDEKELREEWERYRLSRVLGNVFNYSFVPVDVLRQVAELVSKQVEQLNKKR